MNSTELGGKNKLRDVKIGLIEKVLINWATPLDYVLFIGNKHLINHRRLHRYSPKESVWEYLTRTRISGYRKLVRNYRNKEIREESLGIYEETICGEVMIAVCKAFH